LNTEKIKTYIDGNPCPGLVWDREKMWYGQLNQIMGFQSSAS